MAMQAVRQQIQKNVFFILGLLKSVQGSKLELRPATSTMFTLKRELRTIANSTLNFKH
jgi:hypothetical protein